MSSLKGRELKQLQVIYLFVVTISASVHQDLVLLVFFGIEHVVAFLKKILQC
jgi:hypothetical protein